MRSNPFLTRSVYYCASLKSQSKPAPSRHEADVLVIHYTQSACALVIHYTQSTCALVIHYTQSSCVLVIHYTQSSCAERYEHTGPTWISEKIFSALDQLVYSLSK